MFVINKEKEFQIDKLIKVLSTSSKDFVVISSVPDDKSYSILSSIINICVDKNKLPDWTSIGSININDCVIDIKNVIFNNINKQIEPGSGASFYKRKILANHIKKKVERICSYKLNHNEDDVKTKKNIIWPILTTLSSFGVALGVPLFSTLLLRQDQIISGVDNKGALGEPFFYGFLSISIIFILSAILAMFISLANTIKQYRKDYINNLVHNEFEKIIKKYFIVSDNDDYETLKKKSIRNKFLFKEKYIFFYNNLNTSSSDFNEYLQLLKVLTMMNCQCVLVFPENITDDNFKLHFKNIIEYEQAELIYFDRYKNSTNIKKLINFILFRVTLLSGLSSRYLIKNYSMFTNALYRFVDISNSNEQLLRMLEALQTMVGKSTSKLKIDEKYALYFVHIFTLAIIRSLDLQLYEKLFFDLTTYGILSTDVIESSLAKFFRIEELFNKSAEVYKNASLLFEFPNFFNQIQNLRNITIELEANQNYNLLPLKDWLDEISNSFIKRGYQITPNEYPEIFNQSFILNNSDDVLFVKRIEQDNQTTLTNALSDIKSIINSAMSLKINYLLIDLFNKRLTYQLIDNNYELITDMLI